jgi:hypothetical protein
VWKALHVVRVCGSSSGLHSAYLTPSFRAFSRQGKGFRRASWTGRLCSSMRMLRATVTQAQEVGEELARDQVLQRAV